MQSTRDASNLSPAARETAPRVLLVEDEDAVRRVVSAMLRQLGYDVTEAASGRDACALFEKQPLAIKLLVTDVIMPGMNGPALAQRLVALQPQLRVLFISGYADIESSIVERESPNVRFLSKPIQAAQLAVKVRELLLSH